MVVASDGPWVPANAAELDADVALKTSIGDAITAGNGDAYLSLTLCRVPARYADSPISADEPMHGTPMAHLQETSGHD